jgi:hypothetical protein
MLTLTERRHEARLAYTIRQIIKSTKATHLLTIAKTAITATITTIIIQRVQLLNFPPILIALVKMIRINRMIKTL